MLRFKVALLNSQTPHFPDFELGCVGRGRLRCLPADSSGLIIAVVSQKFSGAAMRWETLKKEAYAIAALSRPLHTTSTGSSLTRQPRGDGAERGPHHHPMAAVPAGVLAFHSPQHTLAHVSAFRFGRV